MPTDPPAAPARQRLRRLPGRTPSFRLSRATPSARLWIDDRELVQETVRSYTQEIQRFAFADIQAVQIRRTVRGMVYNIILAVVLALPLLGLANSLTAKGSSFGEQLALGIVCGVFALLLLVNTVRGSTCRTVLTTALGSQHLPSLSRTRVARRVLDTITASTEAVQGALQPEEAARLVDQAQTPQRPPGGPPLASRPDIPLPGYHY